MRTTRTATIIAIFLVGLDRGFGGEEGVPDPPVVSPAPSPAFAGSVGVVVVLVEVR